MTRREFLAMLAAGTAGAGVSWAQGAQESGGMATRGVKPQPRGKPSGLPFHAHFTDVAAHAGLRAPVAQHIKSHQKTPPGRRIPDATPPRSPAACLGDAGAFAEAQALEPLTREVQLGHAQTAAMLERLRAGQKKE